MVCTPIAQREVKSVQMFPLYFLFLRNRVAAWPWFIINLILLSRLSELISHVDPVSRGLKLEVVNFRATGHSLTGCSFPSRSQLF